MGRMTKASIDGMRRYILDRCIEMGFSAIPSGKDRRSTWCRQAIMADLRDSGYSLIDIARAFGCHHTTVMFGVKAADARKGRMVHTIWDDIRRIEIALAAAQRKLRVLIENAKLHAPR